MWEFFEQLNCVIVSNCFLMLVKMFLVTVVRYNSTRKEQQTTWNDLQWERNDLKRHAAIKKDLKRPTTSKKRPEPNCKELILTSWKPCTSKLINWRAPVSQRSSRPIPCLQYFVWSVYMWNDGRQKNQSKCQKKAKRSEKKHWKIFWLASLLV